MGSIGCGSSPAACVSASPTISLRAVFVQSEHKSNPVIYFMRRRVLPRVARFAFGSVAAFATIYSKIVYICLTKYLLTTSKNAVFPQKRKRGGLS
jgi:hypothetical protein